MNERSRFMHYVQEALSHLYDHAYLQTHPLATLLSTGPAAEARGRTLHRALLEAIQELAPPPTAPHRSPAWRKHRYLILRYIEGRSVAEVAEELVLSDRQARRYHHEAVDALSSILWQRYCALKHETPGNSGETENPEAPVKAVVPQVHQLVTGQAQLDAELGSFQFGQPTESTSVHATVEGVLLTLAALVKTRNVAIRLSLPADLPAAAMNRTALRQALLEALLHSFDLVADGRVELSAMSDPQSVRLELKLAVRQIVVSGIARPQVASDSEGRLAVAQRLLEPHGGLLQMRRGEDGLTRVCLIVPCARPAVVLVVDDNADARRLFRRYLSGGMYRVLEAASGAEAVQVAIREKPAVITLDVMMPSEDGWETLLTLRGHPGTRDVPVVVCSVLREHELALSLGATGFLSKPVAQPELLEVLGRCLAQVRPTRRSGSPA